MCRRRRTSGARPRRTRDACCSAVRQPWPHAADLLVANGYDLEVLDREAIALSALPPALRYTNTRILQMHDVWHLVAGYTTSASHEIAISAFQLAQFGHGYSAMFLATVFTMAGRERPEGFPVLGLLVAEAWRHGRSAPSLMAVPWERTGNVLSRSAANSG